MIAAELANLKHGDNQHERTGKLAAPQIRQSDAATMLKVSERTVRDAKAIRAHAPDLAAKVKSGEMKVGAAAKVARERAKVETDPDQAADSVIDATESRHATGDTPRARSLLTALAKEQDDTIQALHHEMEQLRADVVLAREALEAATKAAAGAGKAP